MAINTFSTLFYLNAGRKDSSGKSPIYARVTINGESFSFSTKLKTTGSSWSPAKGRTNSKGREACEINQCIEDIQARLNTLYHTELTQHNFVSAQIVKSAFFGNQARAMTLMTLFAKCNEDQRQQVGVNIVRATYLKCERAKLHLLHFLQERYCIDDLALQDVDTIFVNDLDVYLKTRCGLSFNTAVKFLKNIKHIIIVAINAGYIQKNPFADMKMHMRPVDRGYLTMQEVQALIDKKMVTQRLEAIRDIFIFSCYTGLAYIDVSQLTADNIQIDDAGQWWIVKRRQKTNVESDVMLLDVPKRLIEKYRNSTPDGRLFHIPSNQKTNAYLKEIADLCGIEKKMTFHLARHTFATTITLMNGVPIETVSKMLGHTNIKTTQIYARITKAKISKDMQALAKKIDSKVASPNAKDTLI